MSLAENLTRNAVRAARAYVTQRLEAIMTSTVVITRGDDAVLGADGTLTADPAAEVVYEGPARMGNAVGPQTYALGEEVQFFSAGSCTIPLMAPRIDTAGDLVVGEYDPINVAVNDLLRVTSGDDPVLVGRHFRITDVESVGLVPGGRKLSLVGVQRYPGWVDSAVRHPVIGTVPDEVPPEWRV